MLALTIGISMLLGLFAAVYLGFKERYNANEGTLALLVLETFFVGIGLLIFGLVSVF